MECKKYFFASYLLLLQYLNTESDIKTTINKIDSIDPTPEIFDLFDNIIFIIMNDNSQYSLSDYKKFFNNHKYIKINELMYQDNLDYYLSSQILVLSMFNFFEAEKEYNLLVNTSKGINGTFLSNKKNDSYLRDLNRKFGNIQKYSNSYLFPLMYYFEMKIKLFDFYDIDLYKFISKIIEQMQAINKKNFDTNYTTWLKMYETKKNFSLKMKEISDFAKTYFDKEATYESSKIIKSFNELIKSEANPIDSIYFSKALQHFNTRKFFFDISHFNESTTYWIPEINENFKTTFYLIEQLFYNNLSFSEKSYPMTKKINLSSLLFYYFYDYYIDNHAQQNIKYTLEVPSGSKQESGLYPLIDSINGHLKSILNP